MLKSNNCGELNKNDVGKRVTLAGWVDRRRDHGQLIFIDLRDRSGLVQAVFNPETSKFSHEIASQLRSEYVVQVVGTVSARPAGTENLKMSTGEIEILVDTAVILNTAKTPPFYINEDIDVNENVRLKYRYLDLRRTRMKNNIILRHEVIKFMREYLYAKGFLELETPILMKSTPEGARDYLVPSRLYPGKFYALPQSPQQFKQLLMVAGMEKYFQIARCFRDEDSRKDRQPEFTQLDIEMSFVEEEDILRLLEDLFSGIVEKLKPEIKFNKPFLRLSYTEAMEKYGSDKPDLRFGLPIGDLSDIAAKTEFGVFKTVVAEGGKVKGIVAPGCCTYTRSQLDELNALVQSLGAAGLLTISLGSEIGGGLESLTMDMVKSRAAKFLTADNVRQMAERLGAKMGDLLLIVAGKADLVSAVLGDLRKEMGQRLNLIDPNELKFAFIVDFPLLKWNQEESRWEAMHNPFTQPREEDLHLLDSSPEKVRGRHYDFVCNGYEIAGGSIRIHNAELQRRIFRLFGHSEEKINRLFGQLLEAFEFGAPPHGGVAPGIDRFVMLLAGGETIRDVIVFPKNQSAYDMMFEAPDEVSQKQIDELHIMLAPDAQISK